ncbi:uncharacterized protein SPAPADRAFT_58100 [Spathaspora passalidarum NRRL Y-27907]|uniref:tRNA-splicing endonuclease subunit Sen15 domain-containing protein n=1 Tax=Spathaspora passalidarum (strain NRRL Y-27907 / 11-Y1) TaxID=619300 RepID=G3AFI7_SPAPN|nr:uncharacterized protein SPAPADRAFT_58100 [Spathaspora passalidarum NRRL Y-27907]EGW34976.1 hypothetical protein SPAPADRAFT_58100 [Spathaspora passalidarum NRRL Y-27907]
MTSTLAEQVKINLTHYNQWSDVVIHAVSNELFAISGKPPQKLDDKEIDVEWIVPKTNSNSKLSVDEINQWFKRIAEIHGNPPQRIAIAVVNDDGTIVYYFIHEGIVKPRQN